MPGDCRRDAAGYDIVHTVHVEAECRRDQQVLETRWLADLFAKHGMPGTFVAHAWLHTENSADILRQQAAYSLVRGIRSKPVTRPAPDGALPRVIGSMQDPRWHEGFRLLAPLGLSWDLRVPAWHLAEAADVVRSSPDIPVVLNHTGFPWDRSPGGLAIWRDGMRALAASPNCYCKLSYLCLRAGRWDYDDNRAIVRDAIALFGVERCMFASNFPADGLRVSFQTLFDDFKRTTQGFAASDRRRLFHDNARDFYRIA